ncbi:MAG TPA: polymer-forming cytoskeletal protein, partial [Ktedonobacteraceae bacterium]|nr:polymer-forming cytoskeletal protein [Ktedonobacteraceae bacterium]
MLNVRCRQWLVIALSLALSLIALFVSGGGQILAGITPAVMAASTGANGAKSDCTDTQHGPSFGGTIVVDTNEIECGNLTTFGGTVAINGEVRGDIVAFNSNVVIAGRVDGNIHMY